MKVFIAIIIVILFWGYGVIVGKYQVFPYDEISNIKHNILPVSSISDEYGRTIYFKGKEVIKCPVQSDNTGVILSIGQSNAANHLERMISNKEVPDVINYFNGVCYKASSPLLGASGIRGEFISLLGQDLVDLGVYKRVVVISDAVGSSSVQSWAKGAVNNNILLQNIKNSYKDYKVTDVVWHQGETDSFGHMLKEVYKINFMSLKSSLNTYLSEKPWFIAQASLCQEIETEEVTQAQYELSKEDRNIYLVGNTDKLAPMNMRFDGCHLNGDAQTMVALLYAKSIKKQKNDSN